MKAADISEQDLNNIDILERVASSLSLIGISFILITYGASTAFHKPINRLVFFASFGNIFTNVATLISRAPVALPNSPLCQFQAVLIQMFLPADAYWTFAMACNVYLTFYHKFGAYQLRRLEKWYLVACFGIPLVPALALLAVRHSSRGPMYGNATLWCWIGTNWDTYRIWLFYGPVWVMIILTIMIYARAGRDIWSKRNQLRNFVVTPPSPRVSPNINPFAGEGIQQTTQISWDYENASPTDSASHLAHQNLSDFKYPAPVAKPENTFTVNISSTQPVDRNNTRWSYTEKQDKRRARSRPLTSSNPLGIPRQYTANEANTAIWSYTKVSLLFFIAMMVTWIPSSANRVYSAVHTDEVSLPLLYASAFVLPLQGFWNFIIYAMTSLEACKKMYRNIRTLDFISGAGRRTPNTTHHIEDDREHHGAERLASTSISSPNCNNKSFFADTSSETELQVRPCTKDSSTT
ncbi:Cyclic AMP receptor [Lachnellula suecica]|uniref:Cyclic AMP receptor n=1 Tax=Lachnellula suecica TaxID=602035 RepID=A0A8T9CGA2_9HELO|nr:Cyclic AMP receptor [Lachnellula suecica]